MTTAATRPLALVIGASSGIGRAIAEELAGRGHDLVVLAEDERIRHAAADRTRIGEGEIGETVWCGRTT